jgi:hypothetical protein
MYFIAGSFLCPTVREALCRCRDVSERPGGFCLLIPVECDLIWMDPEGDK